MNFDPVSMLFGPRQGALVVGDPIDDKVYLSIFVVSEKLLQEINEGYCIEVLICELKVELWVVLIDSDSAKCTKRLPARMAQNFDTVTVGSPSSADCPALREKDLVSEEQGSALFRGLFFISG